MPGNHDRDTAEHSEFRSQSELNRDFLDRLKKLEDKAQENAEWIHGNGKPELIENSLHHRITDQGERLEKIESLVKKGLLGIYTMATAGLIAGVKMLAAAIASLLTHKP